MIKLLLGKDKTSLSITTLTTATNTEVALNRLGIEYRKINLKDGVIYFCVPSIERTFDLFVNDEGDVKIWSFVGTVPASKVGVRFEYRKAEKPNTVIGIEATEEGDLSFYVEKTINREISKQEHQIYMMISGYSKIICNLDTRRIEM